MIHIINTLSKQYEVTLDGLENHLMLPGSEALIIEMIHEKFNLQYEKIKIKMNRKNKRNNAIDLWLVVQRLVHPLTKNVQRTKVKTWTIQKKRRLLVESVSTEEQMGTEFLTSHKRLRRH